MLFLYRIELSPLKVNHASWLKQSIVKDLNEIHTELQKLLVHRQVPSPQLVQKVGELVNRLDTVKLTAEAAMEVAAETAANADNKAEPTSATNVTADKRDVTPLDVCPEEYKGGMFGYPWYNKGWVIVNCSNARPLHSVISVLINSVAYPQDDEKHIETVLKGISDTYPTVQVHLVTHSDQVSETAKKYKNVDGVKVDDTRVSKGWNILMTKASTPYVLLARDLFHFTWLTQIERQIRVISQIPHVGVVGGSYRNFSGHWKAGCMQTTLKNFVVEYQEGYYHSRNGCMFCNYLQGPFVTKPNLLKFDESLPNEVVFEDWFLRVVEDGNLIMTCPDAMYFTTDYTTYPKTMDRNVWIPLAKKWELNRVLLPHSIKHSFLVTILVLNALPIASYSQFAVWRSMLVR